MDRGVALRAGLLQAAFVGVVAVALAAALPRSFFVDWGWAAGPGAWLGCAAVAGRVVGLPLGAVLAGAALAGLPSLVGVAVGVHWAGAPLGVLLFGAWCGWVARDRRRARRSRGPLPADA